MTQMITVTEAGDYSVSVTNTHDCSATSSVTTVTVEDNEKPTVHTQNITVQLNNNGVATITPTQINNVSTDNCSIPATG